MRISVLDLNIRDCVESLVVCRVVRGGGLLSALDDGRVTEEGSSLNGAGGGESGDEDRGEHADRRTIGVGEEKGRERGRRRVVAFELRSLVPTSRGQSWGRKLGN